MQHKPLLNGRYTISKFFKFFKITTILIYFFIFFNINISYATTTTGLPWEGPLQMILDSLTGPVAKILGVIAIVISGFGIAFGEAGSGLRRLFQVVFGLSIAFTAASLVALLFGVSSGVTF